ncbi:hypothetical protein E5K00_01465 [Hymenobacter aquaticus]|uniref:Exo-alpha-sialidase n=1 Tax=Hymenobacter aquaticus TaxID=1867101 RepID=A0A4Z0Q4A6_9BACT|nr:hypothetical protein [Hymenobacter aquaticus]TGE23911.1 hypothetical protein E5K00_01465 [Hymenobacter aquaticus]
MKPTYLLLMTGLVAASCQKQAAVEPAEVPDPNWVKLEISTEFSSDAAYSVAGDLDRTLLVATKQKVYASSDQGKTWRESHDFNGPVPGLLQRHDTVFALTFTQTNALGQTVASFADIYTADFGTTWHYTAENYAYDEYRTMSRPIGLVTTAATTTYRIRENSKPMPNSTSRLNTASDLLRLAGAVQKELGLPARHYLNNLHLDAQNRLYVAASGLRFDATTGEAIPPEKGKKQPAILYVSRQPHP